VQAILEAKECWASGFSRIHAAYIEWTKTD
jgi:hypothetical protein